MAEDAPPRHAAAAPPPEPASAPGEAGGPALADPLGGPAVRPVIAAATAGRTPPRKGAPPVAPPIRRPPPERPEVAAVDEEGPAVVILPKPRPGAGRPGAAARGRVGEAAGRPADALVTDDEDDAWATFTAPEGVNGTGRGGRLPTGG